MVEGGAYQEEGDAVVQGSGHGASGETGIGDQQRLVGRQLLTDLLQAQHSRQAKRRGIAPAGMGNVHVAAHGIFSDPVQVHQVAIRGAPVANRIGDFQGMKMAIADVEPLGDEHPAKSTIL